jgi:predicted kinase
MLTGLPCSGKSTWIKNNAPNLYSVSSDMWIEAHAKAHGITYNEAFKDQSVVKNAMKSLNADVKRLVDEKTSFIWDQTNLRVKARQKKLKMIPNDYRKVAVVFPKIDLQLLYDFMGKNRPDKVIPWYVFEDMHQTYQIPKADEGFDQIICINPEELEYIK